jgi:hypothetical protein
VARHRPGASLAWFNQRETNEQTKRQKPNEQRKKRTEYQRLPPKEAEATVE